MAEANPLSVAADALNSGPYGAPAINDTTWDELQRALSQVTVDMQQLVHFASPREISDPSRAAMSSLLVEMRATVNKSLNVR